MTHHPLPQGVVEIYRQSLKPSDSWFNLYFARPLAAPFVAVFARTTITPNQVTFLSTLIMMIAMINLAWVSGPWGLWLGVIGLELSYIFDCVDGQLARVTGRTSEIGGQLDFMMDEIKAYFMIAAISLRLFWYGSWPQQDSTFVLFVGIGTLVVFASAISLTRFTRSSEYARATGKPQPKHGQSAGEGRSGGPLWPIKVVARLISQYPTTLPIFAFFNELDLFLYSYGILHLLYTGQSGLGILIQLGLKPSSSEPSPSVHHPSHSPHLLNVDPSTQDHESQESL